jgi:outer membrane lipoprotein-sorting protein
MSAGRRGLRLCTAFAALFVALIVQLDAQVRSAEPSFESLYRRGLEVNAGLKTLTAHFTETTTSEMLTRPLVATGTIAVERPSHVVLHYEQPERRDILIEDDRLIVSWPSRHIREVTNIATTNRRIQKYFVDSTPEQLRATFTIATRVATDRPHTYLLTMQPRRKQIKEGLAGLDLWIDQGSLLLSAMKMTFPNGETKLMELEKVVVNEPIDPAVFSAAK